MFTKKRSDGTYIKEMPFFNRMLPYVMGTRTEAAIYFEQDFDVTKALQYVKAANAGCPPGEKKLTLFQVFLTATVRTLALRPKLNRFVAGYRYYQRNRIVFNFVAKKQLTEGGDEINVTLAFSPYETLSTLPPKVRAFVAPLKKGGETGTNDLVNRLSNLPRWLVRLFMRTLVFLDYHNGLPFAFTKDLPFFASVFFTNVGSVGIDAPFHHNFEFGTCGLFCAIGKVRRQSVVGADGTTSERDLVKVTFTYDDRITDGIYCGKAIDLLRSLVEDPSRLEVPPELSAEQLAALALAGAGQE